MHLDLVDARGGSLDGVQVLGLEVGDADGTGQSLGLELLQGIPGLHVGVTVLDVGRPVDEVQIDVIEAELGQAGLDGLAGVVGVVGVIPQLGGDEEVLAIQTGGGESASDALLVAVDGGSVDVTEARLQGRADGLLGLIGGYLPGAEAELRDGDAVIEGDGGNAHGSSLRIGDRVVGRSRGTT